MIVDNKIKNCVKQDEMQSYTDKINIFVKDAEIILTKYSNDNNDMLSSVKSFDEILCMKVNKLTF